MMHRALLVSALCFCAVLPLTSGSATAHDQSGRCGSSGTLSLCAAEAFPTQGQPCTVTLLDAGRPMGSTLVRVTYRPNSAVSTVDTLGTTNARGQILWTPAAAGMATLESLGDGAESCELTLPVRFRGIPTLGLVVMIAAGLILFGGNGYSFARTFRRTEGP